MDERVLEVFSAAIMLPEHTSQILYVHRPGNPMPQCAQPIICQLLRYKGYGWLMGILRNKGSIKDYVIGHFENCEHCRDASVEFLKSIAKQPTYSG